jgi:hypothetical protein
MGDKEAIYKYASIFYEEKLGLKDRVVMKIE